MDAESLELFLMIGENINRTAEDDASIAAAIRTVDYLLGDDGGIHQERFGVVSRRMMTDRIAILAERLVSGEASEDEAVEYHQLQNGLRWHPRVNTFRFYFGNVHCYFSRPMVVKKWWQFDRMMDDIIRALKAGRETPGESGSPNKRKD